jgi:hypothetical protein
MGPCRASVAAALTLQNLGAAKSLRSESLRGAESPLRVVSLDHSVHAFERESALHACLAGDADRAVKLAVGLLEAADHQAKVELLCALAARRED